MFLAKKAMSPNCGRCDAALYYGDASGKPRLSGHPHLASPDRRANSNPFNDGDNVRMVCQSCNLFERNYRRISSENASTKNVPIPFVAARWIAAIDERLQM